MGTSYIPAQESLALTWMQTFANGIAADPAKYQLAPADATNISGVVSDYAAAYALAIDPSTRTPVNVAAKDDARNMAEELCRQFAVQIR